MKILIVDDSKTAIMMFKKAFQLIVPDAEIFGAENSIEAEKLLNIHHFNFASLDLNLPGKDGLALSATIREKSADTQMMILTANVQEAVKEKAAKLNIPVVEKPMSPDEKKAFILKLTAIMQQQ